MSVTSTLFDRYCSSKTGHIMAMLVILCVGIASSQYVSVTSFPYSRSSTIIVSANFYNADSSYIANEVADEIDDIFTAIDGIEYTEVNVGKNRITFKGKFSKDVDIDSTVNYISNSLANRSAVQNALTETSVQLDAGDFAPDVGHIFTSKDWSVDMVNNFVVSELYPILRNIDGVKDVTVFGPTQAIYIDINKDKLAANNISLNDAYNATKSVFIKPSEYVVDSKTYELVSHEKILHGIEKLHSTRFTDANGNAHTLSEIASFRVGNEYTRVKAKFNRDDGVVLLATYDGKTNPIIVTNKINEAVVSFKDKYQGMSATTVLDNSDVLYSSIKETIYSIVLSIVVTCLIVYFTIQSLQAAFAISLSIPVSLFLSLVVYSLTLDSINLITITALIVAIGLVVDDSIVVTDYLVNDGDQISNAEKLKNIMVVLIAITFTLVIVYMPYVFSSSDHSVVSKEFGLAISTALLSSLFVSIFITPRLLGKARKLNHAREQRKTFAYYYKQSLVYLSKKPAITSLVLVLCCGYLFYCQSIAGQLQSEVAPPEDKRLLLVLSEVNPSSTRSDLIRNADEITNLILSEKSVTSTNYVTGVPSQNMITHYVRLNNSESTEVDSLHGGSLIEDMLNNATNAVTSTFRKVLENPQKNNLIVDFSERLGFLLNNRIESRSFVILPSDIPGGSTFPIDVAVIGADFQLLQDKVNNALLEARQSGEFEFLVHDTKYSANSSSLKTDMDPGLYGYADTQFMANLLTSTQMPNFVGKIEHGNDNVKVFVNLESSANQYEASSFERTIAIDDYILYRDSNTPLMKSLLFKKSASSKPSSINKTNGVSSITIRGTAVSGISKYNAISSLVQILKDNGISEHNIIYKGSSRSILNSKQEHLIVTGLSLLMVYALLVMLFDSFLIPLIIVIATVPVTYFSGYLCLRIFGLTDNIYTKLAIITAVGLSAKQAIIMMFEVLKIVRSDVSKDHVMQAIIDGCSRRFNAVFMTSFSLVFGVAPLLIQFGYGAVAKYNIAIVIVFCMSISFFTVLYLVPLVLFHTHKIIDFRLSKAAPRNAIKRVNVSRPHALTHQMIVDRN